MRKRASHELSAVYRSIQSHAGSFNDGSAQTTAGNSRPSTGKYMSQEQRNMVEKDCNYNNRHATGADDTRFSHGPEVGVSSEQVNGHVTSGKAHSRALSELPTPPPTPQKTKHSAGNPSTGSLSLYPLFDSYLNEDKQSCEKAEADEVSAGFQRVSSTPISIVTDQDGRRSSVSVHSPVKQSGSGGSQKSNVVFSIEIGGDMDEGEIEKRKPYIARLVADAMRKDVLPEEEEKPITLQDPPKARLKRQLSIDTADRVSQTNKRLFTRHDAWKPYVDEIDGSPPETDSQSHEVAFKASLRQQRGSTPHTVATPKDCSNIVPASPGFVSLADMGLTSPFTNLTPRKPETGKDSVFVFPESKAEEKEQTKKRIPTSKYTEDVPSAPGHKEYRNMSEVVESERFDIERHVQNDRRDPRTAVALDHNDEINPSLPSSKPDVTHKGFNWPQSVSISRPVPFSPRVVTSNCQPRYPQTSTVQSGSLQTQRQQFEDGTMSHSVLEHRTQNKSGTLVPEPFHPDTDPSQLSPHSKEITNIFRRGTLRSVSDVERSPSEKELRDVEEEARKRYERSMSDPSFNPNRFRYGQSQLSGLVREDRRDRHPLQRSHLDEIYYGGMPGPDSQGMFMNSSSSADRRRDPWQSEVRRRLFSRDEFLHQDMGRSGPLEENDPLAENITIPREVSDFLHRADFHPERLQNLQGVLQRPTATATSSSNSYGDYRRQTSSHDPAIFPDDQHYSRPGRMDPPRGSHAFPTRPEEEDRLGWSPGKERGFRGYPGDREFGLPRQHHMSTFRDRGDADRPRSRFPGDLDVRVTCESITEKTRQVKEILKELDHDDRQCKCALVEEQIFQMASDAYRKIHRTDSSTEAFQQFRSELYETNCNVYKALHILCGIKSLCKYGRSVEEIFAGSIVFRMNCHTLDALNDLWESYKSGELEKDLNSTLVTDDLKDKFDALEIHLKVSVAWDEYKKCKEELRDTTDVTRTKGDNRGTLKGSQAGQTQELKSPSIPLIHSRSRSAPSTGSITNSPLRANRSPVSPFRDRKFSDSSLDQSPRRAFQEINFEKDLQSPTKKNFIDNMFWKDELSNSPKSSPKRKSFGFKLENLHPDDLLVPPVSPRRRTPQNVIWADQRDHRRSDV